MNKLIQEEWSPLEDASAAAVELNWLADMHIPEDEGDNVSNVVVTGNREVRVYVGGPIAGMSVEHVADYQQQVTSVLDNIAKEMLITFDVILPVPVSIADIPANTDEYDIVDCDSYSVMQADLCIFCHNLQFEQTDTMVADNKTGPSVGTSMEQCLAWQNGSHTIVFTHHGVHSPWILAKCDAVAEDTDQLYAHILDSLSIIKQEQALRSVLTKRLRLVPNID